MNSLIKKGAEAIIIGCTDLSALTNEKQTKFQIIDSTTTIAKIILKEHDKKNL